MAITYLSLAPSSSSIDERKCRRFFYSQANRITNSAAMRKSTRLLSQFDGLTQLPRSLFVCSTCRQHFLSFPQVAATQSHRNASGNTPFTEKLRQKIWGTKTPPGLEDPYGGESIIEKRARKRRAAAQERKGREPDVQEAETPSEEPANVSAPSSEYVPAQTWDGLEHVGLMGHWDEKPTTLEDMFHGYELGLNRLIIIAIPETI